MLCAASGCLRGRCQADTQACWLTLAAQACPPTPRSGAAMSPTCGVPGKMLGLFVPHSGEVKDIDRVEGICSAFPFLFVFFNFLT